MLVPRSPPLSPRESVPNEPPEDVDTPDDSTALDVTNNSLLTPSTTLPIKRNGKKASGESNKVKGDKEKKKKRKKKGSFIEAPDSNAEPTPSKNPQSDEPAQAVKPQEEETEHGGEVTDDKKVKGEPDSKPKAEVPDSILQDALDFFTSSAGGFPTRVASRSFLSRSPGAGTLEKRVSPVRART